MFNDLLTALALLLVIEGIMPFLSPRSLRRALFQIVQQNDRTLRWTGLVTMAAGVALLYLVRQ
ncbi:DUF2065 domain-containing protein [Arhodomonas sp. SL1]|uniref:DUF2065 domain-containing protein n=1 Tax=Arhodomonas sp. SL1 TaxID=3425691 RepID=UPI003F880FCD